MLPPLGGYRGLGGRDVWEGGKGGQRAGRKKSVSRHLAAGSGALDGVSSCRMSSLRNDNVTCLCR